MTKTDTSKKALLEQLHKTPIVQVACQRAGVARATYYRWLKADKAFADSAFEAIDHGTSVINDMAESQLISAIKDKNLTAIIYWLKSRHPAYITRLKLDANVRHESEELTAEQAELVIRALKLAGFIEGASHDSAAN